MKQVVRHFLKKFYKRKVLKKMKSYKEPLKVNGYSYVNSQTVLGKNCNFNGMKIKGNGKVVIGDNFHSGQECLMITSFHKYDGGNAIPYDSKENIDKDIIIEDNVWLGEGAIIQAGSVVVSDIPKYAMAGGILQMYLNIEILNIMKN